MKVISLTDLPTPVTTFIDATNAFDLEALVEVFTLDALVNPRQREFWGKEAIRLWADREWTGEKVSMSVTHAVENHGNFIVHARMDGNFNKSGLPSEFILTFYFSIAAGKITQLLICGNGPVELER